MRTNVHAEELVRLTWDMRAKETVLQDVKDELEHVINEKRVQQQKMMEELKDATQLQEKAKVEAERYRKVSDIKAMKNQLKLTEVARQQTAAEKRWLEETIVRLAEVKNQYSEY